MAAITLLTLTVLVVFLTLLLTVRATAKRCRDWILTQATHVKEAARREGRRLFTEPTRTHRAGYCYLRFFKENRQVAVARLLGPNPLLRHVLAARPDYLVSPSLLEMGRSKAGRMVLHVPIGAPRFTPEAGDRRKFAQATSVAVQHGLRIGADEPTGSPAAPARPRRDWFGGYGRASVLPLQQWKADTRPKDTEPFVGSFRRWTQLEFHRPDLLENGLRSADFTTLHNLSPAVLKDSLREDEEGVRSVLLAYWRAALTQWKPLSYTLPVNSRLVVTANTVAACEATSEPPSHWLPGAEHGIVFCAGTEGRQLADGWVAVMVPFSQTEHLRCLAGLRLLPMCHGRSDIDMLIVNGSNTAAQDFTAVRKLAELRPAVAAVGQSYLPTNLGATLARGCVYEHDRLQIRNSFCRFGDVYGWDESVLYARSCPALITQTPWCAEMYKLGFELSNVSWIVDEGWRGMVVHSFPSWGVSEMERTLRGMPLRGVIPVLAPFRAAPFKDIESVLRERNYASAQLGIAPVQWGSDAKRHARPGVRWSHGLKAYDPEDPECTESFPGATWRSRERAWGLRNSLCTSMTQGLSPDLWKDIQDGSSVADPALYASYAEAADQVGRWAAALPKSDIPIGIAAVPDAATAERFITARGHLFRAWLFLAEDDFTLETHVPVGVVVLPTVYGTGFNFQLARLLPGLQAPRDTVWSCVNDLETDWIPRELRLEAGLLGLAREDIVFPTMKWNNPTPFQDVTFRGGAIANRRHSFLRTLTNWGWVYGVDEVWCALGDYPTIAADGKLNDAATSGFANPVPSRMWVPTESGLDELVAKGGNFRLALRARHTSFTRSVPVPAWTRFARAFKPSRFKRSTPEYREYTGTAWRVIQKLRVQRALDHGVKMLTIYTWGTRGDTIPLRAAGRTLHAAGVSVNLVELNTPEEGRHNLMLCEQNRALEFAGSQALASLLVLADPGPNIAPDHLSWGGGLAYSLRPSGKDASSPRGGLPKIIDWVSSLLYFDRRAKVRIGAYHGTLWFPRSHDGLNYLPETPVTAFRQERAGWVGGSSSIPVPDAYKGWEPITAQNHFEAFQEYSVVACAGGAGVVQTIASAGARAIAWSNAVDRRYYHPEDAGRNVTGNEDPAKWLLIAGYFWPEYFSLYAGYSPRRWLTTIRWHLAARDVTQRAWFVLFVAYSLRNKHILPSFDETVIAAFLNLHGLRGTLATLALSWASRTYFQYTGTGWFEAAWAATRVVTAAAFSPMTSWLVYAGFHPAQAILYAAIGTKAVNAVHKFVRDVEVFPTLDGATTPGVWLCMTPVWIGGLPLGVHAAFYVPETTEIVEGVHTSERRVVGSHFHLTRTLRRSYRPLVAVRTAMRVDDLPTQPVKAGRYGALWNCQIAAAQMYLANRRLFFTVEAFVLLFWSAYAGAALLFITVVAAVVASSSLVMMLILTPLETAFPSIMLSPHVKAFNRLVQDRMTLLFAGGGPDEGVAGPAETPALADYSEEQLRDAAALLCSDAIRSGVTEEHAFQAISQALPMTLMAAEGGPSTYLDDLVTELYRERRNASEAAGGMSEAWVLTTFRKVVMPLVNSGLPLGVVEGVVSVLHDIFATTDRLSVEAIAAAAATLDACNESGVAPFVAGLMGELTARAQAASASYETRRKNVWMVLEKKRFDALRRADWLALGMKPMTPVETEDPLTWVRTRLEGFFKGPDTELPSTWVRPVYRPRRPRAAEQELAWPSLLQSVSAQLDDTQTERVEKYMLMGGRPALDGIWTGTEDNLHASLERYYSLAPPLEKSDVELAEDVAAAMYAAHPEAFKAPGVVTPETVRSHIIKKYSPGLPFIGAYKTRKDLISSGWMDSIIQATYDSLATGKYPPQAYHAFPKMLVLDAEKLTSGPGKVRTVVAQDLASTFVDQVVQLERNKRAVWPTTDIGIGAPLTATYMGEVFRRALSRKTTFNADVSAFDAHCPPILFEVLAVLARLGANDGGIPEVATVLRSKYYAMQHAKIVLLATGEVTDKLQGGATGQSATSWDNTWAMRAAQILLWSDVTGMPPSRFYEFNTVHNTGDDNIWGTDSDIAPEALREASKRLLGMDFRIDGTKELGTLSYLSKVLADPAKARADEILLGHPVPDYPVQHDRRRILTRRAGLPTTFSGSPEREFRKGLIQRTIGHAALCWYQRDLYSVLASEWIEDATRYLGGHAYKFDFVAARDDDGNILEVTVNKAEGPVTLTQYETAALKHLKTNLALPSYVKILKDAHLEGKTPPPLSPYSYRTVKPSLEAVVREALIAWRTTFNAWTPDALVKLAPSNEMAPFSRLFHVRGYPVEKFVWRHHYKDDGALTSREFAAQLRVAPFGVATDATGFWWFQEAPQVKARLLKEPMVVVDGRMAVTTLYYVFLGVAFDVVRLVPLVGILAELLEVYTKDAPRLFALLNTLHWVETSRSSELISSLSPKDPYATRKQVAVWAGSYTPDCLCAVAGLQTGLGIGSKFAEMVAAWYMFRASAALDLAHKTPRDNAWTPWADEVVREADENANGVIVSAPTATGKSTALPAAILYAKPTTIWLLVPRIILREEYSNPWFAPVHTVKLKGAVPHCGERLVVATYGHALSRAARGLGPGDDDIVALDEFHEASLEMGLCWKTLPGRKVMLSATPEEIYSENTTFLDVPIEREYGDPDVTRLPLQPLDLYLEARRDGRADCSRVLFIVPTKKEVAALCNALESMGEMATPLTADHRDVARVGHIVATNIADSGITISPAPTLLVDSGETIGNAGGQLQRLPTHKSVQRQRFGRVGRIATGAVYANTVSGTGPLMVPVPAHNRIASLEPALLGWVLSRLHAVHPFERIDATALGEASKTDPFMKLDVEADTPSGVRRSLEALWWLRCELQSVSAAERAYDSIILAGWTEERDGLSSLLLNRWGQRRLEPRFLLMPFYRRECYTVVADGTTISASLIRVRDSRYYAI